MPQTNRIAVPVWLPCALAFALGTLSTVAMFVVASRLPPVIALGHFTSVFSLFGVATIFVCLVATIALLRIRRPTTIDCWTAVVATAATLQALEASLLTQRYSVCWYLMHGFGAVAAFSLLCAAAMEASRVARALAVRLSAEEGLRTLAETIPQIVWTALPTGAPNWANKRWFEYTGLSNVAHPNRWQDAVHPGDFAAFQRRQPQIVADATDFEIDLRLRGHDGVFRWFLTRVVPMRDERGRVIRWYGTSTDVDEQRRQAAHLRDLYARERRIAASLQTAFLPTHFPRSAGLAFSHAYLPAATSENLGGDWYDAFRVGEHRIAVCVGDVSGHGLEAAIRMLRVRELMRAAAFDDPAPAAVLERAARSLDAEEPEHTVAALYGVFDTDLRTFTYASAGHPPPALLRDGRACSLPLGGCAFGVELRPSYENHALALCDGDVVALYTDGLIEAARDAVEGERRLLEVLATGIIDAGALASALVPDVQPDDVAVAIGSLERGARTRPDWRFHAPEAGRAAGARASFVLHFEACGASADEVSEAEHALGELLGNVVRHAPGPVEIELHWRGLSPEPSVSDRGPSRLTTVVPAAAPLYAECGRGLTMLRELGMMPVASAREGGGTRVVVSLRCTPFESSRSMMTGAC